MTHQPPVPHAATPPYPLHPAPLAERHGETAAAKASAKSDRPLSNAAKAGIGAAFGIGSAALVAALLYARSGGTGHKKRARA